MLDPRALRQDLDSVARNLARRGFVLDRERYTALEAERKRLQVEAESLRHRRNESAKRIGAVKASGGDVEAAKREAAGLAGELDRVEQRLNAVTAELDDFLSGLPNMLRESVPDGADSTSNVEVRRSGEPPELPFEPLDHVEL